MIRIALALALSAGLSDGGRPPAPSAAPSNRTHAETPAEAAGDRSPALSTTPSEGARAAAPVAVAGGRPPARQGAPWRGAYPGARLVPVGSRATVLGQPQRLAYFTTGAAPELVAAHYARRWRAEGFPSVVQREPSRGAVLAAAFSTRDGTLVAVVAERISPGRTLAFLVVRGLWSGHPRKEGGR